MAKKKAPKSKSKKAKPEKRAPAKKKGPRSQPLPGMEQVRNAKLDNICEGIAEERATKNTANTEEKSLLQSALQVMQGKNISVYKHGGVELSRVPGAERLRVRLTKETGDADASDLVHNDDGESDSEPDQDDGGTDAGEED